jgi:replicative DNA helicase
VSSLDTARQAVRRGWAPIPTLHRSKKGAVKGWQKLRLTEADLPHYFGNGEGVGLLLGPPSEGLTDVDLDCPEAIAVAGYFLPTTRMVHGRPGAPSSHWWYITDLNRIVGFEDPSGKKLLEVRASGQTLVPPSVCESGVARAWETPDLEPARVDDGELLHAAQHLAAAALLARIWPERGRHDATLPLAGALLRAGWGREKTETFVRAICAAARDEEVEDRVEVVRTTAEKLKAGQPATGVPTLVDTFGESVVDRLGQWIALSVDTADQNPGPWGEPIPLADPSPPMLPVDALPPVPRAHVTSVAHATQTPTDMGLPLALAAISVAVQGKAVVKVRSGWEEPVNIYVTPVAPPAGRKSPVFRLLFHPLEEYEVEQARREAPTRQAREDQREVMEKRLESAKRKAASGDLPLEAVEAARFELLEVKVPPLTRLNAPEATPEALVPLMAEQGGRLAIWGPEGDPLDMAGGRYSAHGEARLDVLKKAWTGSEPIRTDRISRDGHHIRRPALTLAICIQPAVLETLRNTRAFVGQGVFGRILWTYPEDGLGSRLTGPDVPPLDEEAARDWGGLLRRLLESSPKDVDDDGAFVPHELRLSRDATEILHTFEREVESELGPNGRLSGIQHWSGKLVGNTIRVATLLHLSRVAEDVVADLWGAPISGWAMEGAARLGRAFCGHALRVFAALEANPRVALAQHVLERAMEMPEGSSAKELFDSVRRKKGLGTMPDLDRTLALLEDHQLLRRRPKPTSGPGRPPSPIIEIHPEIGPQYPQKGSPQLSEGPSADYADQNQGLDDESTYLEAERRGLQEDQ